MSVPKSNLECPFGTSTPDLKGMVLPVVQKEWFVQESKRKGVVVAHLVEKYNISTKALYKWRKQSVLNQLSEKVGNPYILDKEEEENFRIFVKEKCEKNEAIEVCETREYLEPFVKNTAKKLNKTSNAVISNTFIKTVLDKLNIHHVAAQKKTDARLAAEKDARNGLSTLIMFSAVCNLIQNPYLYINYDATQFTINSSDDARVICIVPDELKKQNVPISTNKKNKINDLDFAIKWFCIINAGGSMCNTLIFLCADSELDSEDLHVLEIDELNIDAATNSGKGYLCFTKNRSGNSKFFVWLNTNVLLPYIKRLKELYCVDDIGHVFMCCDGEQMQIDPYFTEDVVKPFNDLDVIIGKLAASTTAITQPCDAYCLFKSLKKLLRTVTNNEANNMVRLKENIQAALHGYKAKSGHDIKTMDHRRILMGLLKIRKAMEKGIRPNLIRKSFEKVGFENLEASPTVKVETILKNFHMNTTTDEYQNIMNFLLICERKMMRDGAIKDKYLLKCDYIYRRYADEFKDRYDNIISKNRCVILNNCNTFRRHYDRLQVKYELKIATAEKEMMKAEDNLAFSIRKEELQKIAEEKKEEIRKTKETQKRIAEEKKKVSKRKQAHLQRRRNQKRVLKTPNNKQNKKQRIE